MIYVLVYGNIICKNSIGIIVDKVEVNMMVIGMELK